MGSPDSIKELGNSYPAWWTRRYIIDYVTCFGLILIMGIAYFVMSPHEMETPQGRSNPTVSYSYKDSSFSTPMLIAVSFFVPPLAVLVVNVPQFVQLYKLGGRASERGRDLYRKTFHDIHNAIFGTVESIAIMSCVMMFFKLFAGRDRPNHYSLIDSGAKVSESRESFPSGHSSFAFTGLTFLTLWLMGRFRVLSGPRPGAGRLVAVFACLVPAFCAGFIAITRTRDNWHNFSDIVCGSVIGIFCSVITYFTLYQSLLSERAGIPKFRNSKPIKMGMLPF